MSFDEEYSSPTYDFQTLPWIFSIKLARPLEDGHPLRIEAKSLSEDGLKFQSNKRVPLFEQIQVSLFDKASGKEALSLLGKVVRLEEVDTGIGEKTYRISLSFISGHEALQNILPSFPSSENPERP